MVIDCHGHYTSEPAALLEYRKQQIAALGGPSNAPGPLRATDDEIREKLEPAQLKLQRDRGTDLAILAARLGHGPSHRRCGHQRGLDAHLQRHHPSRLQFYPRNFVGVCQLPQSPGVNPANCIPELERCVTG